MKSVDSELAQWILFGIILCVIAVMYSGCASGASAWHPDLLCLNCQCPISTTTPNPDITWEPDLFIDTDEVEIIPTHRIDDQTAIHLFDIDLVFKTDDELYQFILNGNSDERKEAKRIRDARTWARIKELR